MKLSLLIFFIAVLCLAVPAQKKLTDRDLEGLKGAVKTVVVEYVETIDSSGGKPDKTRKKGHEYLFDKDGRMIQELYRNYKGVFTVIDGFKTFKRYDLKPNESKNLAKTILMSKNEPIDKTDVIGQPDERFLIKFIYQYDSQGRIIEEKEKCHCC